MGIHVDARSRLCERSRTTPALPRVWTPSSGSRPIALVRCVTGTSTNIAVVARKPRLHYWYRGLSVVGNCYARSTSVAGQAAAGVGQDAPARCGGVAGGVAGRQQDVAAGGFHRCRPGGCGTGGCDGGVDRGPGAIGGGGGVVDATGGRGRRGGGRYGDSDQGGSRCIR